MPLFSSCFLISFENVIEIKKRKNEREREREREKVKSRSPGFKGHPVGHLTLEPEYKNSTEKKAAIDWGRFACPFID